MILPNTAMLRPGAEEHLLPRALDRLARNAGPPRDWAAARRRAAA
ncbi:hypothetical protein [Streptomyces sp. DSM 40750]|nr:hypothetical protein [Streptomyces sp. DSM 40750]UUU25362.1 hypothetical protein JIX55_36805 [Streptomyces sp. DSM 40750]